MKILSVLDKARELADAIAESSEIAELRSTEIAMGQDDAAQDIIAEFQVKQKEYYEIQMQGEELNDIQKQVIAAIEAKMAANPSINAYLSAQEKLEKMLRSVNFIITKAISGENSCGSDCGSDCGPDCGPECGPGCGCN